ncbi:hypothetical protein D3C86_1855620 [compost metagenome]
MAFDGDGIVRILGKPLSLTVERLLGVGADRGRVRVEEDAVADIDGEVLLRTRRCGARAAETKLARAARKVLLRRAASDGKGHDKCDHDRVASDGLHAACGRGVNSAHAPVSLRSV